MRRWAISEFRGRFGSLSELQAGFVNRFRQAVDHVFQHLVVARAVHRVVERGIAIHAEPRRSDLSLHRNEGGAHRGEVIFGAPRGRQLGEPDLEEFPRLEHLRQSGSPFHELVEHTAESTAATQEDAPTVTDFDEPLRFEDRQRLAQGRSADFEPGCQLALRRKPLTHSEVGADDKFPKPFDEILIETCAAEWTEWRRVEAHRADYRAKIGLSTDPLT